jgi:GT2 family glycosyltransferase
MRASIVIGSHNEGDRLWKTVGSCLETTEGLDCEIVVADDASEDGSVEEVRKRYSEVRVVLAPQRRGVSTTKDQAARSSRGDVLVFLDAHCKPEPGAISRLVSDVEEWGGEAIVSPKIVALDAERWECGTSRGVYGFWLELERFRCGWMGRKEMDAIQGPRNRTYYQQPSMIGCSVAMTRDLYEGLQGFDTGMLSHGSEDIDFGLKAWLMGHAALVDPEPVIGHRFAPRHDNYTVPWEHVHLNRMRMARKNYSDVTWNSWVELSRRQVNQKHWQGACNLFEKSREGLERERDFLMGRRTRDEFRYALEYGLTWPLTVPGSPYPAPDGPIRSRFSRLNASELGVGREPRLNIPEASHEPPDGDDEEESVQDIPPASHEPPDGDSEDG